MIKLFLFLANLLILYKNPFALTLYYLFYVEHFYFVDYCLKVIKNWNDYYCISLSYVDISDLSIVEIWIEYCKSLAFSRLYLMMYRKRKSLYSMLFTLMIIILGIPFKIIKISYDIIKINKSFRECIIKLYLDNYYLNKYNKIEIYNGEIYLNCFSLIKLLNCSKLKNKSPDAVARYVMELKDYCSRWSELDKNRFNMIEFKLSHIKLKEGIYIGHPHYTVMYKNLAIYPTSNGSFKLEDSQILLSAMPSAIKNGAKNPKTVISADIKEIKMKDNILCIPETEFNSTLCDVIDIYGLKESRCEYTYKKDMQLREIFLRHTNYTEEDSRIIRGEIRGGCYNYILINLNDNDLFKEILYYSKYCEDSII